MNGHIFFGKKCTLLSETVRTLAHGLIFLVLIFPFGASAIYKCVDDEGKVTYQKYQCEQPTRPRIANKQKKKVDAAPTTGIKPFTLEVTDNISLELAFPHDWQVSYEKGHGSSDIKTLRAAPTNGEDLVMLITAFPRSAEDLRTNLDLLGSLRGSTEKKHMQLLQSNLLESKQLPLLITPGEAHLYTFEDRKLIGKATLPKGEYKYVMPGIVVTNSIIAQVTILINDLSTPAIDSARLALGYLHVEEPLKLSAPPSGFSWVEVPLIKGAFLKPEGWFERVDVEDGIVSIYIAEQAIIKEERFLTGLTVNVFPKLAISLEEGIEVFVSEMFEKIQRNSQVVKQPWRSSLGPFTSYGILANNPDGLKGNYMTQSIFTVNELTGTTYLMIFEAPTEAWDETWRQVGKTLSEQYILESLY